MDLPINEGASTTNISSVSVGSKGGAAGWRLEAIMGDDLAAPLPVNGMGVMVARILGGYMPWAGTATGKTLAKLVVDDFDDTGTGPRPKYRTLLL